MVHFGYEQESLVGVCALTPALNNEILTTWEAIDWIRESLKDWSAVTRRVEISLLIEPLLSAQERRQIKFNVDDKKVRDFGLIVFCTWVFCIFMALCLFSQFECFKDASKHFLPGNLGLTSYGALFPLITSRDFNRTVPVQTSCLDLALHWFDRLASAVTSLSLQHYAPFPRLWQFQDGIVHF